jgi:hypothetical protein
MGIIEDDPWLTRSTRTRMPKTAKPIEVIGEHKIEPTRAPYYAHPASVDPAQAPLSLG